MSSSWLRIRHLKLHGPGPVYVRTKVRSEQGKESCQGRTTFICLSILTYIRTTV